MMMFYVGSALLLISAFVFLIWPFLSPHLLKKNALSGAGLREATNVSLYRDHLSDLDQSLELGAITKNQHQELKIELERNLLEDSQISVRYVQPHTGIKMVVLFAGLGIALFLVAGLLYSHLGAYESWQARAALDQRAELEQALLKTADTSRQNQLRNQIVTVNQKLVAQLQGHIQKHPEDIQVRALLARTSLGLGDYALSVRQYQAILEIEPDVPQIMAELAQAIFLGANNQIVPMVDALVEKTLVLESNNTIALGLAGISAYQTQSYQQAIDYWKKAITIQGSKSPNSIALQGGIEAAQQRLGEVPNETFQNIVKVDRAKVGNIDLTVPIISLTVSLGESVQIADDMSVFIYARSWGGAKLPLAIARLKVRQLPVSLTLDNSMSMMPGMNLSSVEQLELVARVSNEGSPVPQSGDWEATLGPIVVADLYSSPSSSYKLVITKKIP